MSKITLITHRTDFTSIKSTYLQSIFFEYFNIVEFDPTVTYDKNSIIITNCLNKNNWYKDLNYKIIIDNLWEDRLPVNFNAHVWINKNWFWYNEALWYIESDYNNYTPLKTYNKLALMPMRLCRPHRDQLFNAMTPYLDQLIYSYNDRGIFLPDDAVEQSPSWQRFFNRQWYDDTYFSLVAESKVVTLKEIFITEKTFKPIAYQHPFLILGQPKVLDYLRSQGFETYNNIFDESYDDEYDLDKRLEKIINNVKGFNQIPYDAITLEKLIHNQNLFFNKELIIERIRKEIIEPTLEYAEA
jgi:hypothetical protein